MDATEQLDSVTQQCNSRFLTLSEEQLNWRPDPGAWSIAQCLDHIVVSNKTYFPLFNQILNREYRLPFIQRFNPFKRALGPMMIKTLGASSPKKFKSPDIFQPSSVHSKDIIENFTSHQQQLKDYFHRLKQLDTDKLVIASPVTPFITYSLADAMQIIAVHEQRHLNQAMDILNDSNFPAN